MKYESTTQGTKIPIPKQFKNICVDIAYETVCSVWENLMVSFRRGHTADTTLFKTFCNALDKRITAVRQREKLEELISYIEKDIMTEELDTVYSILYNTLLDAILYSEISFETVLVSEEDAVFFIDNMVVHNHVKIKTPIKEQELLLKKYTIFEHSKYRDILDELKNYPELLLDKNATAIFHTRSIIDIFGRLQLLNKGDVKIEMFENIISFEKGEPLYVSILGYEMMGAYKRHLYLPQSFTKFYDIDINEIAAAVVNSVDFI